MNRYYLLFAILFLLNLEVKGQEYRYQRGYYKPSTGTYVQPHMKTYNNETNHDNFSTKYNTNPFTNQKGYRARDYSYESYNYGAGQQIYTGPRGGQYYYNSNGRKVYVPKRK